MPPLGDGVSGESWGVMGDANVDGASIGKQIVDAKGNGNAVGIREKVMVVDQSRGDVPTGSAMFEITNHLPFLGVAADEGEPPALKTVTQFGDVQELLIAIRVGNRG